MIVIIFQLLTAAAVLVFGGEFRQLEEFSYNTIVEKAENSSTYIRNELRGKSAIVQEYAEQLDSVTDEILKEGSATIADLKKNKALDYSIIESSVDIVSSLLRSSMADDAYLILDTGNLYADEGGDNAKASLYLRTASREPGIENGDVEMVFGFDSVAQSSGLTLESGQSQYFVPDPEDKEAFDFYFTPIRTAQENSNFSQNDLGYWSSFSDAASEDMPSMKYSLPLIAGDGTVYGVLGVGLTEHTILSCISSDESKNETIGYVLGYSESADSYDIRACRDSVRDTLLGGADTLHISSDEGNGIYSFEMMTGAELAGSVQHMDIYNGNSPYDKEQWALICVSDRASALWPLLFLKRMLLTAILLSLIVAAVVAASGSNVIIKPLSNLSKQMKTKQKYNEVIRFEPSNIYEIDEITDAITQMQINVQGFSSQVSKMISIADVGLGTFMYDRTDDSVFVGQSLIKVLRLNLPQGEDIMMSRREFLNSIENPEARSLIAAGLGMAGGELQGDHSEVYQINRLNGGTIWLRLGYTYSYNTAIGIVQDITDAMVEKNRIEYERDYDNLTGLLNRQAYYRRIEELFHDKSKLNITAFVMIDLDNLKYVNDTYGHDFGDSYIRTAAGVLKEFQDKGGIVCRLSGDEFNICLPGFSSKDELMELISGIHTKLMQSNCLLADGTHFKVSGSMGISWYPDDGESYELLMKYADFAMYTIKHSTKGGMAEFDINSYETDSVLLTGVEEMNRVIEESSVKYAFQSIISAKTGEIYGYEALMRVQSDIFRSPLELIRTAKTGAKLYEIERMTWTKALSDFQNLINSGKIEKTAYLFINSIANNQLETEVEAFIEKKYSHLLDRIVIEILEGENSDEDCTEHKAKLMQKWGGQFALDDFGTGYNSEYALLNFRPNIVKVDRSIISGCDKDADRRMIIENLVKLARTKNILVLAEGVETQEEMETAISCGVDLLQGFYLSYPLFDPKPITHEVKDTIRRLANSGDDSESNALYIQQTDNYEKNKEELL
ncbi:MAG: GGDEF and EAL domain-containing protein [Oscillospiraceae bacterium]|nr:GGDEF and EAL domain-containing protein [Oscillospiraceae bacterium]